MASRTSARLGGSLAGGTEASRGELLQSEADSGKVDGTSLGTEELAISVMERVDVSILVDFA